jgi:hypothetical protein
LRQAKQTQCNVRQKAQAKCFNGKLSASEEGQFDNRHQFIVLEQQTEITRKTTDHGKVVKYCDGNPNNNNFAEKHHGFTRQLEQRHDHQRGKPGHCHHAQGPRYQIG